ncbi:DAK2 domain-containing protein [Actinoplanes sp. URMC 104]|uniref:DAK2 domain-containing protein n=1 Tax=Actinoplanes sp. URMC 104 TaxID=3423409 RepID=UPI003F1D8483
MLETLDAAAVRRWCGGGLRALRAHQREIDELNVYPVPDGDTGTNLVLTLASAQEALEALEELDPPLDGEVLTSAEVADAIPAAAPASALRRMARGALLGARGNSGVIVSQILRGMADSLAASAAVRGADLARALRSASEAAYAAVARPVEGTVLTVARAAAEAAGRIKSDDLVAVARAAAKAAAEALARTPQQLPALARAGVVDAGGRGLVVLLEALVEALTPSDPGSAELGVDDQVEQREAPHPTGEGVYGYEVQYLLDAEAGAVERLRGELAALGDSLVVVGSGDPGVATWNVHVHVAVAAIGPAVEAGIGAGRPHRITVTPLDSHEHHHGPATHGDHEHHGQGTRADPGREHEYEPRGGRLVGRERDNGHRHDTTAQREHQAPPPEHNQDHDWQAHPERDDADPDGEQRPDRGAVVVAAGDGLTSLFEAEGATVVGRNPSTKEMLEAIHDSRARRVVLLPNDANTHAVAVSAAREAEAAGVRVSVVPTRSPVQALAALAVRDPQRPFADDVIAMAEAAGACRYGEVCTAQRDSLTVAGQCRAGDLLGLVDGEVHVIGADLAEVSARLLDRMLGGGGELVTLVLGADAPAALEEALRGHVGRVWPFAELQCYAGGQPRYHLLIGVE